MDWSDIVLLVAVAIIFTLYVRLMLKNRRLSQMAELECRLRKEAAEQQQKCRLYDTLGFMLGAFIAILIV